MSSEWVRFIAVLESKGVAFEQVRLASDRLSVLTAAGFTDPFQVAILETEWQRRNADGRRGGGVSDVAATTSTHAEGHPLGTAGASRGAPHSTLAPGAGVGVLPELQDYSQLAELPEAIQDTLVASEVLAAAVGVSGTLFVCASPSTSASPGAVGGFRVSPLVPLAMQSLCQTILPVADAFAALQQVTASEFTARSLVAMALGEAVSEVCTCYAHQIARLEVWAATRPMPLMGVVSEVLRVGHNLVRLRHALPFDLLESISTFRHRPDTKLAFHQTSSSSSLAAHPSLYGPRVLNHLWRQLSQCAGSDEDDALLSLMLRRAIAPYLRILYLWMCQGTLEDPFGEFFITESPDALSAFGGTSTTTTVDLLALQRHQQAALRVFPELATSNGAAGSGSSGGGHGTLFMSSASAASQAQVAAFERRFSINKSMIPAFLVKPARVAKMIYFTGKYCCLLRECQQPLPDFDALGRRLQAWAGEDDLQQLVQTYYELANSSVIRYLLSSSVDLLGHLTSLKHYFLHDRGDYIVDFLDNAQTLLMHSPERVKLHSLRVVLQAAIARSSCRSDAYHPLISCSFSNTPLEKHTEQLTHAARGTSGTSPSAPAFTADNEEAQTTDVTARDRHSAATGFDTEWGTGGATAVEAQRCLELLQLDADLQWPLTLVLDSRVIRRLNGIFRLLLWIKVSERNLCALSHTNPVLATFSATYGIKHQLVQFLRQFQFYAAHFVLEPLWDRLMVRLAQADSVFAMTQTLNSFFERAEAGLVLSSTTRFRSLSRILDLTTRFCEVGLNANSQTMPLIERTLHSIQDELLRALSELASPVGNDYPQLVPLLTWIDFSGFYDRNHIYHVQHGLPAA